MYGGVYGGVYRIGGDIAILGLPRWCCCRAPGRAAFRVIIGRHSALYSTPTQIVHKAEVKWRLRSS